MTVTRAIARPITRPITRAIAGAGSRPGAVAETFHIDHDANSALLSEAGVAIEWSDTALEDAMTAAPRKSPIALPGLTEWWDFRYGYSGLAIPGWTGQLGTQWKIAGSSGEVPSLTVDGVSADGVNDFLGRSSLTYANLFTVNAWSFFLVGRWDTVNVDDAVDVFNNEPLISSWASSRFHVYARSSGKIGLVVRDTVANRLVELDATPTDWNVMDAYGDGVDMFFRINGGAYTSTPCGSMLTLGERLYGFVKTGPFAEGTIKDVVFSNAVESLADRNAVQQFLAAKAGLI